MAKVKAKRYRRGKKRTLYRRVNKIEKLVAKLKPETKYYYQYAYSQAISNSFSTMIAPCRAITQGTEDVGNRIGDKIRISSYSLDLRLFLAAGAPTKLFRVIVFTYKHNPDAITTNFATIGNLLMQSVFASDSNYAPMATYDHDNRGSFAVHYDKLFTIKPDNGAATATYGTYRHLKIKPRISKVNREVHYVGGGTGISKNELLVLLIPTDSSTMVFDYIGNFRYTDV